MTELPRHGLTEQTLKNLMFGAGAYFKNLKYVPNEWVGTVLGATSGGGKTSYTPEYVDAELDGALVKVMGGTFKMGETCQMAITLTEITRGIIANSLHLQLAEAQDVKGYKKYVPKPMLTEDDYLENIAFVGDLTSGKRVIFIMDNAICTSALEIEGKNKEQSTYELTFECSQKITEDLRVLPLHLYFPDDEVTETQETEVSEV